MLRPFFLPLFTYVLEGEFSEVCIAPVQRLCRYSCGLLVRQPVAIAAK
jgi:hypothetical protein